MMVHFNMAVAGSVLWMMTTLNQTDLMTLLCNSFAFVYQPQFDITDHMWLLSNDVSINLFNYVKWC